MARIVYEDGRNPVEFDPGVESISFFVDEVSPRLVTVYEFYQDTPTPAVTSALGYLYGPDGELIPDAVTIPYTAGINYSIRAQFALPFAAAGIYELEVNLVGSDFLIILDPVRIVVEERTGWHTLASARSGWREASASDVALYGLLQIARTAVIEYAPALTAEDVIPISYREAQLLHARNVWNATAPAGSNGQIGSDGFAIQPKPLDWHVKQMLRPKRWPPAVA